MKGKTAVANILRLEGVEFLFCFPENRLIDAVAEAGIRPIITRNERTMVNMADGYSRISNGRNIGVCVMQAGPGSENAFSGIAQAYTDSVPILLLPGQSPQRRLGIWPNFQAVRNYREITKWVEQINFPDRIPEMMRRAFTYLRTGKPGPVMLELPEDVMDGEFDDSSFHYSPLTKVRSMANPDDVRAAVKALLSAKNPILHPGQGVLYACAWEELREFAEILQIPVMTTMAGKSVFPEDHPLSVGISTIQMVTKPAAHFLRKSDLIFGIGCSFSKALLSAVIPPGKVMIQVTVDERDINKEYPINLALMGDAKLVLRQLIDEVKKQQGSNRHEHSDIVRAEIKTLKDEWLKDWMPKLTSNEVPINPYRVIWDLMHAVDRTNTIVTHDSGNPRDQMAPFYEAIIPNGYIGWGKSTQLGYGLGLAMGAKLAAPEKMVVNVMGDAAFGMVGMDFETAVRERIPILTILLNNSAMGGYEKHMPIATKLYGSKFLSGNYSKIVEGLGGYSEKVEKPDDILPAIGRARKAMDSGKPALLEMITKEEPIFSKY